MPWVYKVLVKVQLAPLVTYSIRFTGPERLGRL